MSSTFDPSHKFIRVVDLRADGLVEFEFAVGEPELFVEMLLPRAAFEDFCRAQGVQPSWLVPPPADGSDSADHAWTWTLHEALHRASGGDRPG